MSVRWNVKWCPATRLTTPWHAKTVSLDFEEVKKSNLVRAAMETSEVRNLSLLTNSRCCCMDGILPIWLKTQFNQSIPSLYIPVLQSIFFFKVDLNKLKGMCFV